MVLGGGIGRPFLRNSARRSAALVLYFFGFTFVFAMMKDLMEEGDVER